MEAVVFLLDYVFVSFAFFLSFGKKLPLVEVQLFP